jgi:hypothetical protein
LKGRTSTGAGGLSERPRSSFSCRRSGAFCVCGFSMCKLSDERLLAVAIGVGVAIALAIIGYLLQWISS